jgi:hypothetical protein
MTNSSVIKRMLGEYLPNSSARSKRSDISVTSQFGAVWRQPTQVLLCSHINQELMMLHWHSEDNQLPSLFLNVSPYLCLSWLSAHITWSATAFCEKVVQAQLHSVHMVCEWWQKHVHHFLLFIPSQLCFVLFFIPSLFLTFLLTVFLFTFSFSSFAVGFSSV